MDEIKKDFGLLVVTEVTELRFLERINKTADILQIGSRNMQNLELIKKLQAHRNQLFLKDILVQVLEIYLVQQNIFC